MSKAIKTRIAVADLQAGDRIIIGYDGDRPVLGSEVLTAITVPEHPSHGLGEITQFFVLGSKDRQQMVASDPDGTRHIDVMRPEPDPEDEEPEEDPRDGMFGPLISSRLISRQIMALPEEEARQEVAALLEALWAHQRRAEEPTYPSIETRRRWAAARAPKPPLRLLPR